MTLLESYFKTIEGYAEQARKKAGLDEAKIKEVCDNTKSKLKEIYADMTSAGEQSEKINPIINKIIEELNSLKRKLNIEDGITFVEHSDDEHSDDEHSDNGYNEER